MKELEYTLWKAADKLRGSLPASQYKDVILGLVFLKYVSDAYAERHGEEGMKPAPGEFVVPPNARWKFLAENAGKASSTHCRAAKEPGQLIDEAMDAVMKANPALTGTLPRLYGGGNIDQRRLGQLIELFSSARFRGYGTHRARDLMGEVYEYFLGNFARAEGKRGGEFFTPPSVVKVIVEVLEPSQGRIYDPCCGSGGMFVQAEKFICRHDGDPNSISIFGQESIEETWRIANMNLAIHGIDTKGLGARWGDTLAGDQHPDVQMDYVMANPPFNIKDWARTEDDQRWRFGVPPATNANFAWIQHILFKLAPGGQAAVVMSNGSMSSKSNGEGDIRARIAQADLISCMVALPAQLFRSTAIPVCLWFFATDKAAGEQGAIDRSGQVLFIDARELGHLVDRTERALVAEDIERIGDTYHSWRGTASAIAKNADYQDIPGFCKSASLSDIKAADYVLAPSRFVGAPVSQPDEEGSSEKIARLTKELHEAFDESDRLEEVVRDQLGRLG